jgi:quinolinate synthase
VGRCIREFGTDQARLMDAYANSLAQVTAFTRETLTSFNAGAAVATSRPKTEA